MLSRNAGANRERLFWRIGAAVLALSVFIPALAALALVTPQFKVLVFTKTTGFRHDSIPAALQAIRQMGTNNNFAVDTTEDETLFNDSNLSQYQAVIFALTSGDVFADAQRAAFERYIRRGGGFVGIHSASSTETSWGFYTDLVGATFVSHPAGTPAATVVVADHAHPSTASLPNKWVRSDEWYNFNANPRGKVHVLATVAETTYQGGSMGSDHPIVWCQNYLGGRSWYTSLGHASETYSDPQFVSSLLGGIKTAAGNQKADCAATLDSSFDKVTLDDDVTQPMSLAVTPDRRVLFLERAGKVKLFNPATNATTVAASLSVSSLQDHGLQGIALDPAFSTNGFVYLYYTIANDSANRLSRFTLRGSVLDLSSEAVLLSVPNYQPSHCCHQGGSLLFDKNGNLYLSTGDDTTAFESEGYTPTDERAGKDGNDAQRTAGNVNDLRGKILRIHPEPGGTLYTIPSGNLFPADGSAGRPEVYIMGVRNPFRMSYDAATGWLYWGDVGPDAGTDDAGKGPMGYDELDQAKAAGNFGWPYCIGDNRAYADREFVTGASRGYFSCGAPVTDSPNVPGGPQALPPARGSLIAYPYALPGDYPELSAGNRTIEAGPVYHFDPALQSDTKLPAYYDNTMFIYDWSRGWVKEVKLDTDGSVLKLNNFMPQTSFRAPIEMEIGPDGAIYMLEWGDTTDYTTYASTGAKLVRIDHVDGTRTPSAVATASTPTAGSVPLTVHFSPAGSFDPDPGDTISYGWDFTDNGTIDSTAIAPQYTYTVRGNYTARLVVTDSTGRSAVTRLSISAGNNAPVIDLETPVDGQFHILGQSVPYKLSVTDAEDGSTKDGTIDCNSVSIKVSLGHDNHSHDMGAYTGCSGEIPTSTGGHTDSANIFTIISVTYVDRGAVGVGPVTVRVVDHLQPSRKQAESYSYQYGIQTGPSGDLAGGGGDAVSFTEHNDYISFKRMNLKGMKSVGYRAGSAVAGGRIQIHVGSWDGPQISEAVISNTGTWTNYQEFVAPVTDPGGTNDLFIVFQRPLPVATGDGYWDKNVPLFTLNWIDFFGLYANLPSGLQQAPLAPSRTAEARTAGDIGQASVGESASSISATNASWQAPYQWSQLCAKVPPQPDLCQEDFQAAKTGLLEVGGSRVIATPTSGSNLWGPHVSRVGAGSYFTPGEPGTLTVWADAEGVLSDGTAFCIGFDGGRTCTAGDLGAALELIPSISYSAHVSGDADVLVQACLENVYSGAGSATVKGLHATFTPDRGSTTP